MVHSLILQFLFLVTSHMTSCEHITQSHDILAIQLGHYQQDLMPLKMKSRERLMEASLMFNWTRVIIRYALLSAAVIGNDIIVM